MAEGTGPHVAVVGASFAGLFAAAAASAAGCRTTLLERDELPEHARPRPGVPQGAQSHVLIHGGLLAAGRLLPGLRQDLLARGAVPVDTGRLPWLGEHGWWPQGDHGYEVLCLSRPALEEVVRRRVLQLPGVRLRTGTRVAGLHPAHGSGWCLDVAGGEPLGADVVVDASGRGSRLPRWLAALGLPAARVETVDARIGYASRRYAGTGGTAVVLPALPGVGRGGNALPLEDGQWLVSAVGAGEQRPPRDVEGFLAFLASLADPVLHEQALRWEPLGDVAVHRQTANVRHHHESVPGWPAGLLAVGDALCAFDPVYGQGIAVAARQALVLGSRLARPLTARTTRRL